MTTLNVTEAIANLYSLIDEASTTHKPIRITGKRSTAILLSEEDCNAVNDTLFLVSIPGMRDSIIKERCEETCISKSKRKSTRTSINYCRKFIFISSAL
jgi:antitoxin YefM